VSVLVFSIEDDVTSFLGYSTIFCSSGYVFFELDVRSMEKSKKSRFQKYHANDLAR
jgi:hypothetical protein